MTFRLSQLETKQKSSDMVYKGKKRLLFMALKTYKCYLNSTIHSSLKLAEFPSQNRSRWKDFENQHFPRALLAAARAIHLHSKQLHLLTQPALQRTFSRSEKPQVHGTNPLRHGLAGTGEIHPHNAPCSASTKPPQLLHTPNQ